MSATTPSRTWSSASAPPASAASSVNPRRRPPGGGRALVLRARAGRSARPVRLAWCVVVPEGPSHRRSAGAAVAQDEPGGRPGQALIRAAASSMARGKPSRRRQMAATAAAFSAVNLKSGRLAEARSTKSATAGTWANASSSGKTIRCRQRQWQQQDLSLATDMQRRPASGENGDGRTHGQQRGNIGAAARIRSRCRGAAASACR